MTITIVITIISVAITITTTIKTIAISITTVSNHIFIFDYFLPNKQFLYLCFSFDFILQILGFVVTAGT